MLVVSLGEEEKVISKDEMVKLRTLITYPGRFPAPGDDNFSSHHEIENPKTTVLPQGWVNYKRFDTRNLWCQMQELFKAFQGLLHDLQGSHAKS